MNENSSKQVLLSVIGIAVLVVAVVGVSFAFFTYSKAGDTNNTLTTGSIFFNFTEGTDITLEDQFPMTNSEGLSLTNAGGKTGALTFNVLGYDGSGKGIEYTVYALEGGTVGTRDRFKDSEIKLNLTAPDTVVKNNYATPKVVGTDGSLANGVILAKGKITATSSTAQQNDEYTLRMWINGETTDGAGNYVTIGENETYTTAEFGNLYYSLKLKVVAATTSTTQPSV
ncbi:MAG: hypothetical protein ACI4WF_03285 [Bacilli bacterium]